MIPAPEVLARPAVAEELPRNAIKLAKHAAGHGWASDAWYSRGQGMGVRVVDQVAVRFRRNGHTLVAFWHDGRTVGIVSKDPLVVMNVKEATAALAVPPDEYRFELNVEPDDLREKMRDEYELCKTYISGHPLDLVDWGAYPDVVDIADIRAEAAPGVPLYEEGQRLVLMGIVEELKLKTTKRKTQMATFMLTDLSGGVQCVAFGEGYGEMANGMLILVRGEITSRYQSSKQGEVIDDQIIEFREFKVKTANEVDWSA